MTLTQSTVNLSGNYKLYKILRKKEKVIVINSQLRKVNGNLLKDPGEDPIWDTLAILVPEVLILLLASMIIP